MDHGPNPYITRIPGGLSTRSPSDLNGGSGCFLWVSDLRINRRRNKSAPSPEMSQKKASKWMPIGYPSSLEELLNRLFVKRLQYRIRPCLPMFAPHLVAC